MNKYKRKSVERKCKRGNNTFSSAGHIDSERGTDGWILGRECNNYRTRSNAFCNFSNFIRNEILMFVNQIAKERNYEVEA